jgi:hypothetical protein
VEATDEGRDSAKRRLGANIEWCNLSSGAQNIDKRSCWFEKMAGNLFSLWFKMADISEEL